MMAMKPATTSSVRMWDIRWAAMIAPPNNAITTHATRTTRATVALEGFTAETVRGGRLGVA